MVFAMQNIYTEWSWDMGLGNPSAKLLCHPMYKRIVVNGVIFDYIPACGLPVGLVDETVQNQTQSEGEQSPGSAQNDTEDHSVENEPVTHVLANELSPISTDCSTDCTKDMIEHSSTITPASIGVTHVIELSDDEDNLEVITVIPSKRRAQENAGRGMKDSRMKTNIYPKPHGQGTQDCPLEIESDSDSEPSPFSGTSEVQSLV